MSPSDRRTSRPHSPKRGPAKEPEAPVLPQTSRDETDVGWGDDPHDGRRDEEWYRRERPPHHE